MTTRRAGFAACLGLVLLGGCGLFDDDERLSGERIHIRNQQAQIDNASGQQLPLPAPAQNAEWTQTNGRANHASGHLAGPASPSVVWSTDIGAGTSDEAAITSAPVVVGGRVYVLDAEAKLSAVDASSGNIAWETSLALGGESGDEGFGGGIAAEGGMIFATTGFGEILGIDAGSGEIRWRQRGSAPFRAAPAVDNGLVIGVTRENRAVGVDARSGQILWRLDGIASSAAILGGASPAMQGELAVLPFASGEVIGAQARTGRRVWSAVLGGARRGLARASISDVTGDPVIAGQAVIVGNQSGRIVAIDGATGRRGWTRSLGAVGPIWAAGASIFLVSDDSALMRLALQSGETLWRTELPAYEDPEDRDDPIAYSGPVLAGGRVLVTDSLGDLLLFDPQTGAEVSRVALSGGSVTGPVVAGGTIYVLTDDGVLQALR